MRYMVVRTEQLTKQYGRKIGIRELTLEVEPGEVFGLLGQHGSGKTTIFQILMDFVRPSSGRALVLGMDSRLQSLDIRRSVGYLPAHFSLDPCTTGARTLQFFGRLRGSNDWGRVEKLASILKVDLTRPARDLGSADQRKIGLIQAFMHQPELVLLDEPTAGLDVETTNAFYQIISSVRADGRSVLFGSSSIMDMERACDRTAVIHAGTLLAVERGVRLRSRAMRRIEMRFAGPISSEALSGLSNVQDIHLGDNSLSCTVRGDTDELINAVSKYSIIDIIIRTLSLDEIMHYCYGVSANA